MCCQAAEDAWQQVRPDLAEVIERQSYKLDERRPRAVARPESRIINWLLNLLLFVAVRWLLDSYV